MIYPMITTLLPIIKKVIKSKWNTVISWCKKHFKSIAVIIILILTAFLFYTHKQLKQKNEQLDRITNNYEYYSEQYSKEKENNSVLQLSITDFKQSQDSLIQQLHAAQKEMKIKDKQLVQTSLIESTVSHDTTFIVKSNDFTVEIKPNELTSIVIDKKDSVITHQIEIKNSQILTIYTGKKYRNQYKNWFTRLLHLDFKKKTTYNYGITNSNDLIQVENTRIVELSK